jgi:hypothetical protein
MSDSKKIKCASFFYKFLLMVLIVHPHVSAQEMWGISNSNFSGNMGIFLNPVTIVGAPYQYEIILVAFEAFAENANVYALKNERSLFHGITGSILREPDSSVTSLQSTFAHTLVIGPSYIRNLTTSGWGIHTAYRSEYSGTDIPPAFAQFVYYHPNSPDSGKSFSFDPFSAAYATWLELGGTYGKIIRENEWNVLKWALNVNFLAGLSGYYVDANKVDFTTLAAGAMTVHGTDVKIGEAMNTDDQSIFGLHGAGLGTTIGIQYIKGINRGAFDCNMSNDRQRKYKYRLGFSVMDLGLLYYFNNARVIEVNNSSDVIWNGIDSIQSRSIKAIDNTLASEIGGTTANKSFSIWLPLAFSMQFDYQIRPNLFANLSTVNRLHFKANQIARGNQVNLSARYERRRY